MYLNMLLNGDLGLWSRNRIRRTPVRQFSLCDISLPTPGITFSNGHHQTFGGHVLLYVLHS